MGRGTPLPGVILVLAWQEGHGPLSFPTFNTARRAYPLCCVVAISMRWGRVYPPCTVVPVWCGREGMAIPTVSLFHFRHGEEVRAPSSSCVHFNFDAVRRRAPRRVISIPTRRGGACPLVVSSFQFRRGKDGYASLCRVVAILRPLMRVREYTALSPCLLVDITLVGSGLCHSSAFHYNI